MLSNLEENKNKNKNKGKGKNNNKMKRRKEVLKIRGEEGNL